MLYWKNFWVIHFLKVSNNMRKFLKKSRLPTEQHLRQNRWQHILLGKRHGKNWKTDVNWKLNTINKKVKYIFNNKEAKHSPMFAF